MAAASGSYRGFFWPDARKQCAENRIQATIYRPVAGDAVRTSSKRTSGKRQLRKLSHQKGKNGGRALPAEA